MGFTDIAAALVPVAALIAVGFGLRRTPLFRSEDFWAGAEKLAYFVLLPTLLFRNIAAVDVSRFDLGPLALALVLSTLAVGAVLCLLHRVLAADAAAFTSVFQGGIRFNTYIGLSLSAALVAGDGLALAAIVGAILVPLVNVASSLVFELFLVDKHSWLSLVRTVVLNPLLLLPAATVALLLALGVSGDAARVGLVFQAIATAPSAYVMARQLGGNAQLMAAIIGVQTLVSMATLPLVLGVGFRLLG